MRCSRCDSESPDGMAFCGKCGAELKADTAVICPKCGSTMPPTATFCGICGRDLGQAPPENAPPENAPPENAPPEPEPPAVDEGDADPVDRTESHAGVAEAEPEKRPGVEAIAESPSGSLREMVLVPQGWMAIGSSPDCGNDDEHPRHQVEFSAFYIDRCTVSNIEYERFDPQHRRLRPEVADEDNDPVVFVSHGDCLRYCRWRAEQEGLAPDTYGLPTEAQWERVARGAVSEKLYPWGDEVGPDLCNTVECGRSRVLPVDQGPSNDFGLFHLGSNVREWCLDYYSADYYGIMEAAGPDPTGPHRTSLVNMNVVRGASFQDKATELGRCAARNYAHPNSSSSDTGFRCVRMKR